TAEAKARADKKNAAIRTYLTSHGLASGKTSAKKICLDCRRGGVKGKQRVCLKCAGQRKRRSYPDSKRRRRLMSKNCEIRPLGLKHLQRSIKRTAIVTQPAIITRDNCNEHSDNK